MANPMPNGIEKNKNLVPTFTMPAEIQAFRNYLIHEVELSFKTLF